MSKQKRQDAKKRRKESVRHQRTKEKKTKIKASFKRDTSMESVFTDIMALFFSRRR